MAMEWVNNKQRHCKRRQTEPFESPVKPKLAVPFDSTRVFTFRRFLKRLLLGK